MRKAQADLGIRAKNAEIAFFGGSFTAIDRGYMLSLLDAAKEFEDSFAGIRVSTRPDCVDDEVLDILQAYHVTAQEVFLQCVSPAGRGTRCAHPLCSTMRAWACPEAHA